MSITICLGRDVIEMFLFSFSGFWITGFALVSDVPFFERNRVECRDTEDILVRLWKLNNRKV